jgi:hypothetical protein
MTSIKPKGVIAMVTLLVSQDKAVVRLPHATVTLAGPTAAAQLRRLLDDCGYGYDGPWPGSSAWKVYAYRKTAYTGTHPWGQ